MIGSDLSHHLPSILEAYEWGQTIRLSAYPDFYSNFLETNDAIIRPANEKSCWESFIEGFQAFFAAIFACLCCDYRTELERTQDFLLDRTHTMSAVIQKLCDLSAYINTNINKLPIEEVASANALIINTLESRCRHYEAHDKDEIHLALATSLDIDALACNEHLNVREPKIIPQSLTVQSTLEQLVLKDLRLRRHS
ncbi:MAG: hypothetical protein FJZ56_06985, partial [Chlamydiae bacterium]|nr:hypothetical protein [Chlamydiota bacterium]